MKKLIELESFTFTEWLVVYQTNDDLQKGLQETILTIGLSYKFDVPDIAAINYATKSAEEEIVKKEGNSNFVVLNLKYLRTL